MLNKYRKSYSASFKQEKAKKKKSYHFTSMRKIKIKSWTRPSVGMYEEPVMYILKETF